MELTSNQILLGGKLDYGCHHCGIFSDIKTNLSFYYCVI